MGIENIFDEGVDKDTAVDDIRAVIREKIDEAAKQKIDEKYKKVKEEEDESEDEEDDEDDDSEEEVSESDLNEAMQVSAHRAGAGRSTKNDEFKINRMSDLKKLAKSRQYDYFMVTNRYGEETDYTVDPQGNLVEM